MNENDIILRAEGLKEHFTVKNERGKKKTLYAVDGVDLEIKRGETFGLVGESGCGKSTLGKTLLRLYDVTDGKILFNGEDVTNLPEKKLKDFRTKAQMIFQDPASCLNPRRRVEDIITEPYAVHRIGSAAERAERAAALCDQVGLSQSYLRRYPHEMSGGQKQRVGIARAIALKPELIVCDEPVSALDVSIQAQIINLLKSLQEKRNLTYLFISHDLSVVEHISDTVGVMYLGNLVEYGETDDIFAHPLHPYTKALFSAIPIPDPTVKRERVVLQGSIPSPANPPSGCKFHTRCPYATERCKTEAPKQREVEPGHYVVCHLYEK